MPVSSQLTGRYQFWIPALRPADCEKPEQSTCRIGKRVFLRKLKVALIVGWHTHHSPRAIVHYYIICHPDRDVLATEGIDGQHPGVKSFFDFFLSRVSASGTCGRHLLGELLDVTLQRRAFQQFGDAADDPARVRLR